MRTAPLFAEFFARAVRLGRFAPPRMAVARLVALGAVGGAVSVNAAGCSSQPASETTARVQSALTPQAVLNELKVNPPATDQPYEYAEVQCNPSATLSNLYFVSMEGDSGNNGPGTADLVVPLDGVVCGSNGLVLIKAVTGGHAPTDAATTVVTNAAFNTGGPGLENGTNSFLLIESATNPIVQTTDYDSTDSGTLALPAGAVVLDAVGWTDGGTGDIVYGAALTQSTGTPDAASRFPADATPSSVAAWYCGDLAGTTNDSVAYSATIHSATFPSNGVLTPGAVNVGVPAVVDAGVDAGTTADAGVDAGGGTGTTDAGSAVDATTGADATSGAGSDDAGAASDDAATTADTGPSSDDAGAVDDAGEAVDAGGAADAGQGEVDAGEPDAGPADTGAPEDAGSDAEGDSSVTAPVGLVISQVYGGGGNSNATYTRDFVELFNRGTADVALGGLAIMYGGGTHDFGTLDDGSAPDTFALPSANLAPGQYFLIGLSSTSATGADLPTVDGDGTIQVGATNGKIALAVGAAPLGCGGVSGRCGANPRVIDIVGFGTGTDFEGTAATAALSNTTAAIRKSFGCVDTKQNSADFAVGTPTPRNSQSPEINCADLPEAGAPDAGGTDAGPTADAGSGGDAGHDSGTGAPDSGGGGGKVDAGGKADAGNGGGNGDDAGSQGVDAAAPSEDSGTPASEDAGQPISDDAGNDGGTGEVASGGGCSCRTAGEPTGGATQTGALGALVLFVGGLASRRRRRGARAQA
jgi:MYXO-CTERM domain-containing protein